MWKLVAEKKECTGDELFAGNLATLQDCANTCSKISSMFVYGTNDFSSDKRHHRCFANSNGQIGCNCFCETQATNDGTCETGLHLGYRLYKFSDHVRGNLHIFI